MKILTYLSVDILQMWGYLGLMWIIIENLPLPKSLLSITGHVSPIFWYQTASLHNLCSICPVGPDDRDGSYGDLSGQWGNKAAAMQWGRMSWYGDSVISHVFILFKEEVNGRWWWSYSSNTTKGSHYLCFEAFLADYILLNHGFYLFLSILPVSALWLECFNPLTFNVITKDIIYVSHSAICLFSYGLLQVLTIFFNWQCFFQCFCCFNGREYFGVSSSAMYADISVHFL